MLVWPVCLITVQSSEPVPVVSEGQTWWVTPQNISTKLQ